MAPIQALQEGAVERILSGRLVAILTLAPTVAALSLRLRLAVTTDADEATQPPYPIHRGELARFAAQGGLEGF